MKNFEKFKSKELSTADLSKIKGGVLLVPCEYIFQNCMGLCHDFTAYLGCVLAEGNPDCSPVAGFEIYCNS